MRSAAVILASSLFSSTLAISLANPFANPSSNTLDAPELAARAATTDAAFNVVSSALYQIGNTTQALGKQIAAFSVDSLFALQASSSAAVGTIMEANNNVSKAGNLSLTDAVGITPIIQNLAKVVNATITTAIEKKEAFGGVSPIVLYNLQQQQNATLLFTTTTDAKLPQNPAILALSANLTVPIFNALASGIAVFKEPNVNPKNSSVYSSSATSVAGANYATVASAAGLALFMLYL